MPDPSAVFRDHYDSTELAETEHFLRENYADMSLHVARHSDGFRFRHDTTVVAGMAFSRLRTSIGFDAAVTPPSRILVSDLQRGALAWTSGRDGEVSAGPGGVNLAPIGVDYHAVVGSGDFGIVALDRALVAEYAAHTCGIAPDALEFAALTPISPGLARYWRAAAAHVRDDILADPGLAAAPLLADTGFRSLAAALLSTFPNTALTAATDPEARGVSGDVSEATLRDVADYLDAYAGEPVGPAEVAERADAPYREVTEGLRRRHGTHPAELLWAARLRGARRDLEEADPAGIGTVAMVAARWGFDDVAAFVIAYTMATGGEPPERTLER